MTRQDKMFTVFILDLAKLGCQFKKSLRSALCLLSGSLSMMPKSSCAIIFSPNVGLRGDMYGDDAAEESQQKHAREVRTQSRTTYDWFKTRPMASSTSTSQCQFGENGVCFVLLW